MVSHCLLNYNSTQRSVQLPALSLKFLCAEDDRSQRNSHVVIFMKRASVDISITNWIYFIFLKGLGTITKHGVERLRTTGQGGSE